LLRDECDLYVTTSLTTTTQETSCLRSIKPFAHAKANVAVRLIGLRYTEKGNLSGLVGENADADDLLEYGTIVLSNVQRLDSAVTDVEKTEKWHLLRVHGAALNRYLAEGGQRLVREEFETTTGIVLPYETRWIKSDTLAERFDSGTIKRSTLVVTAKTKKDADAILAKGLSFGGRRQEAHVRRGP
jgi:hypothetical protein